MATQSGTQTQVFGADASKNSALWTAPGQDAVAVTKSDSTIFTAPTRGLYVGGTGDVAVRMWYSGNSCTFASVPAGSILPIAVDQVLSTGTTATTIVRIM